MREHAGGSKAKQMAAEWPEVLLGDIAAEVTVGHVGPMATEYVDSGIPMLRSLNVEPLRINRADIKYITPEFHRRLGKSALSPGDVVIVRTGRPGSCAVIPASLPVANCSDLVIVRCGPLVDATFLAYAVNTVAAHHVHAHTVGAVQQHFNVGSARTIRLRLPQMTTQRAIVRVLGALDDKIELNRQMSRTLEETAQAIFKSWFIDFDGHTDLVPSELGPIPRGWDCGSVSDVSDLNPEVWSAATAPGSIAYLDLSSVKAGRPEPPQLLAFAAAPSRARRVLRHGDTIIGTVRPENRSFALIHHPAPALTGSTGFALLRPRTPDVASFVYLATTLQPSIDYFSSVAHGSAYPAVAPEVIHGLPVVLPPPALRRTFASTVDPLLLRVTACEHEARTLTSLRDLLLPKLISGEIRIPDAGKLVGEVT